MKNIILILGILLSIGFVSGVDHYCFDENQTIEDLEVGSQMIDTFNCKVIEMEDNVSIFLPAIYLTLIIIPTIAIIIIGLLIITASINSQKIRGKN